MTSNLAVFILSIVTGFVVTGAMALWKYSNATPTAVLDMLSGQLCSVSGLLIGSGIVALIFAFTAGKLTGN